MLTILIKAQTVSILSNIYAGKFKHIISKRTKLCISIIDKEESHYRQIPYVNGLSTCEVILLGKKKG